MTAKELVDIYISFFEKRGHKRIENSSLVPKDDPSTLFTSSGMQALIPYLLGQSHKDGTRLVNVQNCFRAQDINEIGDNRHTTFFRMLGNWSLGDYFKSEQIPWFFEFLTKGLGLDPKRFYVSCFSGYKNIPQDEESANIWRGLFNSAGIDPEGRIFYLGVEDNWWSRSGTPDQMPDGEPGGPDNEVYFDFKPEDGDVTDVIEASRTGRLLEIGNSVFMTYRKTNGEFEELPQKNVDFGGGLERLLAAVEGEDDVFKTSLFYPIIQIIESCSKQSYKENPASMRIVANHFISASLIIASGVEPSNKMQGSVLRRLIRTAFDNMDLLKFERFEHILDVIVEQYKDTDPKILENYELIKNIISIERDSYRRTLGEAKKFLGKEAGVKFGDELKGLVEISSELAFKALSSYGLSPTQLKSLGFTFDDQKLAELIKEHQAVSRSKK
jgi:alanyl-tRNA synthetase